MTDDYVYMCMMLGYQNKSMLTTYRDLRCMQADGATDLIVSFSNDRIGYHSMYIA